MEEGENENLQMSNFSILWAYLKTDVARLLTKVLQTWYEDINDLRESNIFENLENESKEEISKCSNLEFRLSVLYDVLLKEKCETRNGNESFVSDVRYLKEIWKTHIMENENGKISSDEMLKIKKSIEEMSDRMTAQFGEEFVLKKIQPVQSFGKLNCYDVTIILKGRLSD